MPRLLIDISAHGFGHLAQAAPVVERFHALRPDVRLCVRSGLSRERLARRIAVPFEYVAQACDFGYVMRNAIDLDLPATAGRYRAFHDGWVARVDAETDWLAAGGFDAVLANVAYLPLAGAERAGVPSLALCSLNWADLFHHYFAQETWAAEIHEQMLAAYRSATNFLAPLPSMPMPELPNRQAIGPICRLRRRDRGAIARLLGLDPAKRWVLWAMGGIDFPVDASRWPPRTDVQWLMPAGFGVLGEAAVHFDSVSVDFTDVLASVDAVVTKPGYGTFVEAACHGIPVLYVPRGDWPEEPFLAAWLKPHARVEAVNRDALLRGEIGDVLDGLWSSPAPPVPLSTGAEEAALRLAALFELGLP